MGGGIIVSRSLKTRVNGITKFSSKANFIKKSYMTPLYLLKVVFPKFHPFALYVNVLNPWPKC
jgi:hypothetical protein